MRRWRSPRAWRSKTSQSDPAAAYRSVRLDRRLEDTDKNPGSVPGVFLFEPSNVRLKAGSLKSRSRRTASCCVNPPRWARVQCRAHPACDSYVARHVSRERCRMDFIERYLGFAPDRADGSLEAM